MWNRKHEVDALKTLEVFYFIIFYSIKRFLKVQTKVQTKAH